MLNSLSIISYYGFIRTYWTAKQNAARANIDLAFSRVALAALAKHQTDNDTTANQTLLDTEAAAQSAFLTATQGNRAGVVTDEELATSLATYKEAKASRRAAIPNCQTITDSITQQAQETFELFQRQYDNKVNGKPFFGQDEAAHQSEIDTYKSYLIYAQSLRDTAADFAEKLDTYVTMSEQKLDQIETTGKAPETYQDIIDASSYTFDGTYSDAVNHIAPTGQLYGQIIIVQAVTHLYWWEGEKWYRIPDEIDQAASVTLLPTGRPFGTIFRVPSARYNASSSSYEWDYYLSTGDGWELMTEYCTIEGIQNVRNLIGYHVGDYHRVIERAVPVMWNGFENQRINLSSFIDDVGVTSDLAGIVATATDLRGDHNELLESFFGYQETVAQQFIDTTDYVDDEVEELDESITNLDEQITNFSSDGWITLSEANSLKIALRQVIAESTDIVAIATEIGVVTEKAAYQSALVELQLALFDWIDQEEYPIEIAALDREEVVFTFEQVQERKTLLHNAIGAKTDGVIVDYVDEQIEDVTGAIGIINDDIAEFSSDGFITFVESKALKISFIQLQAESTDIVAVATALEITTEKTAYVNALVALDLELADWVGKSEASYPLAVISDDRTQINNALALVKSTRDTLAKKIRDLDRTYVNDQIDDVNEALGTVQSDILEFSSDGFISFTESVSLKTALGTLNNESTDLVAVATSLGITTQKTNYSTALTNLSNAVAPWIDLAQSAYPKAVTTNQRADLLVRLESVQNTKSLLVNEIIRKRQEDVAKYVNNQIADANSSQTALYNEWNSRVSDSEVTAAEAASLRLIIAQYLNEVDGLKAIADGAGLNALALTYYNAAQSLVAGINAIINSTYSYPIAVSSAQKASIEALFVTAKSTKKAVIDALTETSTYGVGGIGFDVSQFRKIYDGFIRGFTPELRLVYISQNELSLQPNYGDFDYLKVNDQNIEASKRTSVFTFTPVLGWNEGTQSLYTSLLQADTEYWVYLANRDDRWKDDIPGGVYDYRGRLFCSGTSPSNNYLGEAGLGLHAILIGKAETDSNTKFRHELDVSLVSRQSDLKETFREFSNFDLAYTDEDTLTLGRIYGTYGQIYVPESLYFIGENREVYTTSPRIEVYTDETLIYDTSTIGANTLYYVYIAADSDIYNFNEINPDTNLPWHPEDSGDPSLYDEDKDFRLWLFLSTKEPEEGRLAETYQGYWARHIGQVRTDGTGKFIYSSGVSAIRQATLNPTYFDGLAEISLQDVSTTTFRVIRKRGTSGIVMVGSKGVLTYDADNPSVHTVTTNDTVYSYNEATPASPLSSTSTILDIYIGRSVHLYFANDRPCWGSLADRTFLCNEEPTDAYLSQNYPGNNARWIAEIQLAAGAKDAELITNGNFEDSNDWDLKSGSWVWSEENLSVSHIRETLDVITGESTDCSDWYSIERVDIVQSTPGDVSEGIICHIVSFDDEVTWKVFKSSEWISIVRYEDETWQYLDDETWTDATSNTREQALIQATDQAAYQWTKINIEAMDSDDWGANDGFSASVTTVDWAVRLIDGSNLGYGEYNTSVSYATAGMTANNAPSPNITSGHEYSSSYASWKAFNRSNTSESDSWVSTDANPPCLMFDFGSGNGKIINKYAIQSRTNYDSSPLTWKLQGSNNASAAYADTETANDWTTLDTRNNEAAPGLAKWMPGGTATCDDYYTFINSTSYQKYRIRVTLRAGTYSVTSIGELKLVEAVEEGVSSTFTKATFNVGYTNSLDQISMTVVAGGTYELIFTTSAVGTGSVTPKLGNTDGTAVTSAGLQTQYIIATNTDVLKFVPTTDFNGAVDTVSCKKVEHGAFTGSYLVDSIAKQVPYIDDTIVSSSAAWSSAKIMQIVTDYLGYGAAIGSFIAEKTGGLNVRLEYVDTTTIRLMPHSGADTPVIFEDGSSIIVPAAGFTKTVSGAASTRYYVYLRAYTENPLLISDTPPNNLYTKLETLGTANIQVGDLCMTSTNTMSGAWNVCSSHQEPTREWSKAINSALITLFFTGGVILSKRAIGSVSRTGTTNLTVQVCIRDCSTPSYIYLNCATGSSYGSATAYGQFGCWSVGEAQTTVTLSNAITEGIHSSVSYSAAVDFARIVSSYCYGAAANVIGFSHAGNLVLTRTM